MGFLSNLVDTVFGGGSGKASESEMAGYDRANSYLQPYEQGGREDYNTYRGVMSDYGKELEGYGNPYEWMWNQASKDPRQLLSELMSDYKYTESPEAKYAQEQAMKAATQGAAASGMLGSGSLIKSLQQNAYDIASRDETAYEDRYLNNVLGLNDRQMLYGNNLQGERNNYRSGLAGLAELGVNTANLMGQNEIGKGGAQARGDTGRAQGWQNLIGAAMSFLPGGAGAQMLMNGGRSYGFSPYDMAINKVYGK